MYVEKDVTIELDDAIDYIDDNDLLEEVKRRKLIKPNPLMQTLHMAYTRDNQRLLDETIRELIWEELGIIV